MASTTEPESTTPLGESISPGEVGKPVPTSHPPALYFFFWGEFAERFLDLVRPQNVDVRASAESQHDVRPTGRCFPKGASNLSVRPERI